MVLIDGLTKNWRCPGWRVCWVAGPKDLITALNQAGSYLDGGASHPMQVLALQMLDKDRIKQDRIALQRHFRMKRKHVLSRLDKMGLHVRVPPKGEPDGKDTLSRPALTSICFEFASDLLHLAQP